MKVVEVRLWNDRVGALVWDAGRGVARFQYDADFLRSGLHPGPLLVSATRKVQQFPELGQSTAFLGLPGFIADSLPGNFGNQVLQAWLSLQGRQLQALSPLERLSMIGTRGIGALEYLPDALARQCGVALPLNVGELAGAALLLCADQQQIEPDAAALEQLITACLATSRPGALLGWNPQSDQMLSGQALLPAGFEHWQLAFDNGTAAGDVLRGQRGRIEYAYHEMAHAAGINVMECRLHHEGKQAWFMARRADRVDGNSKVHRVSFAGLAHLDQTVAGTCSYEGLFQAIRELRLGQEALNESYRRMLFNICARNQQDSASNHAFLMFGDGQWQLAPASDLAFNYQPGTRVVGLQQMTCNGKRDNFTLDDLLLAAKAADVKRPLLHLERVQHAMALWPEFAGKAGLSEKLTAEIGLQHRSFIDSSQISVATAEGPAQRSLF